MKKIVFPILVAGMFAFGMTSCGEDCDTDNIQASIDAACGVDGVDGSDQAACDACYDAVYDATKCAGGSNAEAEIAAGFATFLCD